MNPLQTVTQEKKQESKQRYSNKTRTDQDVYSSREFTVRKPGKPPVILIRGDNFSEHQGKGLDHK